MTRSWNEVRVDRERRDRAAGCDVDAARRHGRAVTDAYVLRRQPAERNSDDR